MVSRYIDIYKPFGVLESIHQKQILELWSDQGHMAMIHSNHIAMTLTKGTLTLFELACLSIL